MPDKLWQYSQDEDQLFSRFHLGSIATCCLAIYRLFAASLVRELGA